MNLYLVTQSVNDDCDTYAGMVICAESEEEAKTIHPDGKPYAEVCTEENRSAPHYKIGSETWQVSSWARKKDLKVQLLGKAESGIPKSLILASFRGQGD